MNISVIHLSDIHITSDNNPIETRIHKLYEAIRNEITESEMVFLIISGDVCFSGKKLEYEKAKQLIDELCSSLKEYCDNEINIIVIPGNHDCNYEIEHINVRNRTIENFKPQNYKPDEIEDTIRFCSEVQKGFNEFVKNYDLRDHVLFENPILKILEFKESKYKVIFHCFNTAWNSLKNDTRNKFIPCDLVVDQLRKFESDLSISLLHHPYGWFLTNHDRDFRNLLTRYSDIVISGHEHISDQSVVDNLKGVKVLYIEGDQLQEVNGNESGFNIIKINLDKKIYRVINLKFSDSRYSIKCESQEFSIDDVRRTNRLHGFISRRFSEDINEPGASYHLTNGQQATLNDIFVFPDLQEIDLLAMNGNTKSAYINSENLFYDRIETGLTMLILGEDDSGKSTLINKLTSIAIDRNYIPIKLDGEKINSSSLDDFRELVKRTYDYQYSDPGIGINISEDEYRQLDINRFIILIDDFHTVRLSEKYKQILLRNILSVYKSVLLTASEKIKYDEYLYNSDQENSMFADFETYEIREFGYVLRDTLINKWYSHSFNENTRESEKVRKTDRATKIIESVIGRKFIPSYPFFLLTIIQYLESDKGLNLKYSSHADYYQLLISQDLYGIFKKDELNLYLNYLSELAYDMFIKEKDYTSKIDLELFHNKYNKIYDLKLDPSKTLDRLVSSTILKECMGGYEFKYKYEYFFFVSSFISKHLNEEPAKNIITKCFYNLHIEKYANIIIFLTYHVNDDLILDKLIEIARNLFKEYDIVKLEDDVAGINPLIREIPKLIIQKQKDYRETRKDVLTIKDKNDKLKDQEEREDTQLKSFDEVRSLKLSTRIDFAFRLIQILGQILKNYYGSLQKDKKNQIVEESYFLTLRCLKSIFDVFERGEELIINIIREILKEDKQIPQDKIEEHARKLVFFLFVFFSVAFIRKITERIGYDKILETYKNILDKHQFNTIKLIDISINLDFNYPIIPIDELRNLMLEFDKNFLAKTILTKLVRRFIYMYPIEDRRNLQQLANILNIPLDHLIIGRAKKK
jgi:energy-coupling factor transporter ATP-binding protein EcfA2